MATVKDIYQYIDSRAPFNSQLGFDNSGFLVGRGDKKVTRILVALDITEAVAREAAVLQVLQCLLYSLLRSVHPED